MDFIYKANHSDRLPSKGAGREFASGLRVDERKARRKENAKK